MRIADIDMEIEKRPRQVIIEDRCFMSVDEPGEGASSRDPDCNAG